MLRSLWKLQWKQFAARMKKGNGKKTSGGWLVFLMLFFVVCMEILMFVVFAELVLLCEMGLTWLYFAMAGTVALALSMLGSVFMTQAQLYDAKDNERLLSMPIPPKYILLTRIAMLFTTTAGYTLAVLLPAFGIYAFSYGASATMIIGWLFTFVGSEPDFAVCLLCARLGAAQAPQPSAQQGGCFSFVHGHLHGGVLVFLRERQLIFVRACHAGHADRGCDEIRLAALCYWHGVRRKPFAHAARDFIERGNSAFHALAAFRIFHFLRAYIGRESGCKAQIGQSFRKAAHAGAVCCA